MLILPDTNTPALRLAPELLCTIFSYVVQQAWHSEECAGRAPRWVPGVTHVCQYWRSVALNDPQLWCRISSFESKWSDIQLERSKNLALSCRIPSSTDTHQHRTSIRIKEALEHAQRICSLSISTSNPYSLGTYGLNPILRKLYSTKLPILLQLTLSIDCDRPHAPDLSPEFIADNLPQLKHLRLSGFAFRWTSPFFVGLTSLRLDTEAEDHSIGTLAEFLDALERMPLLEKLYLKWVFENIRGGGSVHPSRIVPMAHLQTITLHITSMTECVVVFSHIAHPMSTRIRCDFEAEGAESPMGWYDEDQIGRITVPALGSCLLQLPFLSSPPTASTAPSDTKSNPCARTIEIGTHFVHYSTRLVFKAWLEEVDFTVYSHPSCSDRQTRHGGSQVQVPPPAVYVSFSVGATLINMPASRQHLLFILPLTNLQSIALDQDLTPGLFEVLSDLPYLRAVSMKNRSSIAFFQYFCQVYDNFQGGNTAGQEDGPSSGEMLNESINSHHKVPFHPLQSLAFECADFGPYIYPELTRKTIKPSELLGFLRLRRDTVGLPIHRIRLTNCVNLSVDVVEKVKMKVQDVEWDGRINMRTEIEYDTDSRDEWETDEEGWDEH